MAISFVGARITDVRSIIGNKDDVEEKVMSVNGAVSISEVNDHCFFATWRQKRKTLVSGASVGLHDVRPPWKFTGLEP